MIHLNNKLFLIFWIITFGYSFFSDFTLLANSSSYFRNFSVNDGLSQNTVWALIQDRSNRMWIGTGDGLNVFDGYVFKTYYHSMSDSLSIADNNIRSLCLDQEGDIWVGTLVGLSHYNKHADNFTNYALGATPVQVLDIVEDVKEAVLYLATNHGLIAFHKKNQTATFFPFLENITINSITKVDSDLYLSTPKGVYYFSCETKTGFQIMPVLNGKAIATILVDQEKHCFWIATLKDGIFKMNLSHELVRNYKLSNHVACTSTNTIRVLQRYVDDKIWVGTTDGLFIFDPLSESYHKCYASYDNSFSVHRNSIRSMYVDNQGGLWLGTYYSGVNYYHPLAPSFNSIKRSNMPQSLNDNIVSCIVEEKETGNLWIGTNSGGVNYYDKRKHIFKAFVASDKRNALKSNNIKAILLDEKGNVYVGTHAGGLSYIHTQTGKIDHFAIPDKYAEDNSCYALLDDEVHIWVGSMVGLYLFDKRTKQFYLHPLTAIHQDLKDVLITNLFRDSCNRIWIATEKGLYVYTPEHTLLNLSKTLSETSSSCIITYCITEDVNHNIWIASSNGLYRYTKEIAFHKLYTVNDGLPNNFIYGILEDDMGHLWLSTNKGLSCLDIQSEKFHNYNQEDGLSHNEFNQYAYCKGSDNILYFGGLDGITYFEPFRFIENPFAPKPTITGVSVLNQPVTYSEDGDWQIRRDSLGNLSSINIPYNMRQFNIQYTVSNYLSGKQNAFAYKLEGFDKDWNYTSERNMSYSNLSPQKYIFKVKARNNNGVWSKETTEFVVDITPMWYQTWMAKAGLVLLSLFFVGVIVYFLLQAQKMKMQMKLDHYKYIKNEELNREKVQFYMNMSHELRTPLSLILAPMEELMKQEGLFNVKILSKLRLIQQNSQRLLYIINQLLNFRKAEAGALPIHVANYNLKEVCYTIYTLFTEEAFRRNIDYQFTSDLSREEWPIDKGYLETILINLLSNAFKFTSNGGQIAVVLDECNQSFSLTVRDNGKGIPPDKLAKVYERFYQVDDHHQGTGIGLSLVKCLVEKHHGSIRIDSEVNKFTEFVITLPGSMDDFSLKERVVPVADNEDNLVTYMKELEAEFQPSSCEVEETETTDVEKPTILLVDDNQHMLQYLREVLSVHYTVLCASNGKAALGLLKNNVVDVVLSDVMMPEMDGLELCAAIKRNLQTCHLPVILLSAKSSIDDQASGIGLGADDYICKPFSLTLLEGKLANILKSQKRLIGYYRTQIHEDTVAETISAVDNDFLMKTIQIIENNTANKDFSTDDLAAQLNMSRSNLYLKMNAIAGEPPANFIRRIRFDKVCKLLLEGKYTIAEISYMTGFSSPSYLSSSFKKYMGMLPSEYIKGHANKGF